ncbi:unnamed protein product [Darwinula stevensoni]|uniref:Uncharacterized protein n=1 Tax=Darwinula stevensoni TaxID=69355 RepID=A0A7R9FT87_9CRUS|nr:unnamed protein product [Darwinula stevensoni]CAG0904716.1 unnamed protein product [Darwinula stevensoni]
MAGVFLPFSDVESAIERHSEETPGMTSRTTAREEVNGIPSSLSPCGATGGKFAAWSRGWKSASGDSTPNLPSRVGGRHGIEYLEPHLSGLVWSMGGARCTFLPFLLLLPHPRVSIPIESRANVPFPCRFPLRVPCLSRPGVGLPAGSRLSPTMAPPAAERVDLSRKGLTRCPYLQEPDSVFLLNLEHNLLRRIEALSGLGNLVVLSLYDNQIDAMDGLSGLASLKLLLLGKNRERFRVETETYRFGDEKRGNAAKVPDLPREASRASRAKISTGPKVRERRNRVSVGNEVRFLVRHSSVVDPRVGIASRSRRKSLGSYFRPSERQNDDR